ncbi:hypothetical protein ACFQ0K_17810 [Nocardioides caeni]|uniref:hypothetical protein n=1 Tax=Nocardioides caeni TaxID=574700 RepID=UPI0031EFED4F
MDPSIVVRATGDFRRLTSDLKQAEGNVSSFGSKAKAAIVGAGLVGTAALVKLGAASVSAASDAQQSIGATESVFGKYADTVIKRSAEASKAVGLSANEYRELANVTGASLASTGLPMRRVTDLTDQLTRRASDLAATFGGTTKEAIEAVSSLLRGEADPIERYGVSIKQSDVNARLAAKGLDELEGSARKQAEQQARLDLLFKQTSKSAGQFASESDTLSGQQQRLNAQVEDLEASFGELLLPILTDVTAWASDNLIPALQDLQGWVADNKDEIREFAGELEDRALPPLEATVDVVKEAVGWFSELPGPVKEVGIQAGIAALVLPKLAAGATAVSGAMLGASAATGGLAARLAQNRAAMSYQTTVMGKAREAMVGFGGAARTAAGVGGMVALMQSTQQTDDKLKVLTTTAGGALLGFSLAGPIGLAIGAGAGALVGLASSVDKAADAATASLTEWSNYADTLNKVTGAATKVTREKALMDLQSKEGLIPAAQALGIAQRDLVSAMLGQEGALARVNAAIEANIGVTGVSVDAYGNFVATQSLLGEEARTVQEALTNLSGTIDANAQKVRDDALATQTLADLFKGFPKAVITDMQTVGIPDSMQEVRRMTRAYNLTPKQIKTLLQVTGVGDAVKNVNRVSHRLAEVDDTKVTLKGWLTSLETAIEEGAHISDREQKLIGKKLKAIEQTNPNLKPYVENLRTAMRESKTTAAGATQVGTQLKTGLLNGMAGTGPALTAIMTSAVRNAIAAARAEADINSPSRETEYIGRMLGDGLVGGMRRTAPKARTEGAKLIRAVLGGIDDGAEGIDRSLERITKAIRKHITGKNEGAREARYLKSLRNEFRALNDNGRAQDRITRKLEAQRDKLRELRDEYAGYATMIKDAVLATGDVTQMGRLDDGTVSLSALLSQADSAVIDAERFTVLMEQLADDGLSESQIQQMLAAGPAAALATAEAIASGGDTAIAQLNAYADRLAATGQSLSKNMADRYYGAGVAAQQGIVAGLESEAAKLDRAAIRLANRLVKAVKTALGIRSPSQEFRDIADDITGGLTMQLKANDTYVHRTGQIMASSLVKGFGQPQLGADAVHWQRATRVEFPEKLEVSLHLSADNLGRISRGEQIVQDASAYFRSGGRAFSRWGGPL